MAYRTTEALVETLIEVESDIDLEPFILTANELVTEACGDSDLSSTRLELIERWLAAHFYCMLHPRTVSEHAGPVGETKQSKVDFNLKLSHYGQTAMVLDTTGALAALSQQPNKTIIQASVDWLGTDES